MEVIVIESEAFYSLVEKVVSRLSKAQENDSEEIWIHQKEAEKILGLKSSQLYRLRTSGHIRYTKPSYKIVLYDKNSIHEYLEKNARETF